MLKWESEEGNQIWKIKAGRGSRKGKQEVEAGSRSGQAGRRDFCYRELDIKKIIVLPNLRQEVEAGSGSESKEMDLKVKVYCFR
jgi:hypothetical protein